MSVTNLEKKTLLYFLQLVAGVVCYAFMQVTVDKDLLAISAHIMLFESNEEFRKKAIENGQVPPEGSDSIITMGNVAQMLLQVSFCCWVITFFNLISQFPKFYQADAGGKRSLSNLAGRFNFEYVFHSLAGISYAFLTSFLLVRLLMMGAFKQMWNVTFTSIFGLIAGTLHCIYTDILRKEYKQHSIEAS